MGLCPTAALIPIFAAVKAIQTHPRSGPCTDRSAYGRRTDQSVTSSASEGLYAHPIARFCLVSTATVGMPLHRVRGILPFRADRRQKPMTADLMDLDRQRRRRHRAISPVPWPAGRVSAAIVVVV